MRSDRPRPRASLGRRCADRLRLRRIPATLRLPLWYGLLATLAAAGAVTIVASRTYQTEWAAAALWAAGLAIWARACRTPTVERPRRTFLTAADLGALAALLGVGAALLLPELEVYPLEVVGDPPRDSGQYTQWILRGDDPRIFRYGFFNSYSLVMSLTSAPFHLIFGASSLSFKGLSAAIGIVTPLLLFLLARRHLPFVHALAAAFLLLALPVYLFYARREPINAYNSLWMLAVIAALLAVVEQEAKPRAFGRLGLVAGITVHFHAGVKAASFAALAAAAGFAVGRACTGRQSWRRVAAGGAAALLGFSIGLGPLLLQTDVGLLLSSGRLRTATGDHDLAAVLDAYQRSLRVFFDQPTSTWFPVQQPLIPSVILASLFALGATLGFLAVPLRVHAALVFFLLMLPLTNSALTDRVNGDHRLTPLLPVIAWVMAMGLAVLWRASAKLRPAALILAMRVAAASLVAVAAAGQVARFWSEEQGRHRGNLTAHLMYFALREIEATPELREAASLCVGGNPWVSLELTLDHFRDGWLYYLPGTAVRVAELGPTAANNEIFVSTSCEPSAKLEAWRQQVYCSPRQPFVCPGAETGYRDVRIHVEHRGMGGSQPRLDPGG